MKEYIICDTCGNPVCEHEFDKDTQAQLEIFRQENARYSSKRFAASIQCVLTGPGAGTLERVWPKK